jgi:hypothetical protein
MVRKIQIRVVFVAVYLWLNAVFVIATPTETNKQHTKPIDRIKDFVMPPPPANVSPQVN